VSFADAFADDLEPAQPPDPPAARGRPAWLGPPDGELGVAVPVGLVLGRGEQGVIALSHALAYSTGLSLDLVARVGGLERRRAGLIFHEQHAGEGDPADLPDGFLRFGLELPDGTRVSNLGGRRRRAGSGDEPAGPILTQQGGGGGQSSGTSISWSLGFWLWPLPAHGTLRLHCEWPVAGIALSVADLDAAPLLEAASRATRLWEGEDADGPWTRRVSQHVMSATSEPSDEAGETAVPVPAGELRAVEEALQAALRLLRRLER
jgi:hypothetical protein